MQSIVGSMNVPHGGLQVLVTCNSRYIHYIGIRCVDTLCDCSMTQTMRRRMVDISVFYRRLKHISNRCFIRNIGGGKDGKKIAECLWCSLCCCCCGCMDATDHVRLTDLEEAHEWIGGSIHLITSFVFCCQACGWLIHLMTSFVFCCQACDWSI